MSGGRGAHLAALLAGLLAAGPAVAAPDRLLPVWEAGIGAGGGWLPDYPAAGQNHFQILPLPYVIYRGSFLRLGEEGLARGMLVDTERLEFDLSFAGSFPVDAEDNDARQGMDDLDYLGEIGPRLSLYLLRPAPDAWLRLDLALRAVLSTDLSNFGYEGIDFNPAVVWHQAVPAWNGQPVELDFRLGSTFADNRLMDYFYEVEDRFVTPERAAFDADGGYLGSYATAWATMDLTDRLRASVGGGLGYYGGATNDDSPLFIDELNLGLGAGFVWQLYRSEAKVLRP